MDHSTPEYYVQFSEYHYTVREDDPNDEWDRGDYGLNVTINSLHRSPTGDGLSSEKLGGYDEIYGYDDIEPGVVAYIVIVEYTDGDTFGSNGYWSIAAIKRNEKDADAAAKLCADPEMEGRFGSSLPYRPWDGYFARLDSVRVEAITVAL